MVHITYYSPAWPPAGVANGIVTYVSVIRDYLLRQGHQVSVLTDGMLHLSDGTTRPLHVPSRHGPFATRLISRLDRRLGHHPFIARRLAAEMRHASMLVATDLIEMEESFGWSGSIQRSLDVPIVTRLHGPQCLKPKGADALIPAHHKVHRERAEGRAIQRATALTAPTAAVLGAIRSRYRCTCPQMRTIPNPVIAADRDALWDIRRCEPETILCVGRIDLVKGADTLVAAFAQLLAIRPTAQLILVGPDSGAQRADGSVVRYLDLIRERTSPQAMARITVHGLVTPAAIQALRRRAFVTVVASRWENFPYAAVEAMAAGCPLISTRWPGADEIIEDGFTGWLTPIDDSAAMAARIAWVFDHPDAAAQTGLNAWRQCSTTFSADAIGARMLDFYRDVLAARRQR